MNTLRTRWDITTYTIELRVFVREPRTNRLLAVENSYHASLTRKSPRERAAEVLAKFLKAAKKTP